MEAVVVWTEFAESKLTIVFNYYKEKASLKNSNANHKRNRNSFHEIGETTIYWRFRTITLEARAKEYRYLVQGNYKIIYFVEKEKNEVVIAHLFDSRQNPSKIEETK